MIDLLLQADPSNNKNNYYFFVWLNDEQVLYIVFFIFSH